MNKTRSRLLVAALALGISSLAFAGTKSDQPTPAKTTAAQCGGPCCGTAAAATATQATPSAKKDSAKPSVCRCGAEKQAKVDNYNWV